MRKVFRTHIVAENSIHRIACDLKEPHKLTRVIRAVVIGIRHPDQIDCMRLCRSTLQRNRLKRRTRRLIPAVGKAPCKSAAVERDNGTGEPRPAHNRRDVVANQPRRTAAHNRKQGGRLLHIRCKRFLQILLRTEYNRVVVELRAGHAVRDCALTVLDVAHGKIIAPERAVDHNDGIPHPCKERRRARKRAGVGIHADIVEGFFPLTHRSALPCSHAGAISAAYHRAVAAPSTSRPMAGARGRAGAASYRRAHAS